MNFSSLNSVKTSSSFFDPSRLLFGRKEKFDPEKFTVADPMNGTSWGLAGKPNASEVSKRCAKLQWQEQMFNKHPKVIKRKMNIAIGILVFSFFLFFLMFIPIILAIVYIVIISGAIASIKIDLIKYAVARKNGWLYDPDVNRRDANTLNNLYSKFFKRGIDRYVEDQTWGDYSSNGVTRKFHSGSYTYVTENNSNKNKTTTPHPHYFFAVELEKSLPTGFILYQENIFSKIGQKFSNKEVDVESIKFNKTFAFSYTGKKADAALEITKILSPSVQLELLELNKKGKNLSVMFDKNTVVFLFRGKILRHVKTKFNKGIQIAQEDLDLINDYLQSFNMIANGIISKI